MFVIRGLNLRTEEAWDAETHIHLTSARESLEKLREKRGPWKEDPIVYGLVDPATKREHERPHLLNWLKSVVP